jgi:hypothetical protein
VLRRATAVPFSDPGADKTAEEKKSRNFKTTQLPLSDPSLVSLKKYAVAVA